MVKGVTERVGEALKRVIVRKPPRMTPEEYLIKLSRKGLKNDGSIIGDPVPIEPPIGYQKQPSMMELVRDMVRSEKFKEGLGENESFEEADDFDVGDEPDLLRSPHEFEDQPSIAELVEEGKKSLAEKEAAAKEEAERAALAEAERLAKEPPTSPE